ncbi:MAG: TolC family protein [Planctomycetaceae bacterium]|nr:TolC family protein [Planctomycetaceae bacterium]
MRPEKTILITLALITLGSGCATTSRSERQITDSSAAKPSTPPDSVTELSKEYAEQREEAPASQLDENPIQLVGISYDDPPPAPAENEESITPLSTLEQIALDHNPKLVRLYHEYQAAVSRSHHVDKLPDPKIGANVFGNPIETASGSQQANLGISQTIPWLERLSAEQQQACFEAFAIRSEYRAERLRVLSGVRVGWYRLYVLDRQIESTITNQELLQSLIDVANARISTGQASQGDVLLGTLELSQLEERLLTYRKQKQSVAAEINRLLARPAETPIEVPDRIEVKTTPLSSQEIHQVALSHQPEIEAARVRTQATRWGIEVARLKRRPDVMFSANYLITDDNRPPSGIVNVGEDPWSVGVQVSVPLWREKYDSIRNEAGWKHQAAQRSVQEISDRYDALILDLVTEAQRAAETAQLYESTILPQARQTLAADQTSYSNGAVEFDRVIRDYRSVLMLELEYQKAIGDLATANARLEAAAGRLLKTE